MKGMNCVIYTSVYTDLLGMKFPRTEYKKIRKITENKRDVHEIKQK